MCLRLKCVLVLSVFVWGLFVSRLCFGFSGEDASLAISTAEAKVVACYGAVAGAQEAGANVSHLLSVLNEAGWFLSRAKLAYSEGDFDSAVAYANECSSRLDGFVEQAEGLRLDAERAGYWDFMVNFVGSGVGALCVVVGGFAVWFFLKRREEVKKEFN